MNDKKLEEIYNYAIQNNSTYVELAQIFNMHRQAISYHIRKKYGGLPRVKPKVTKKMVKEWNKMYNIDYYNYVEISNQYNVTFATVSYHVKPQLTKNEHRFYHDMKIHNINHDTIKTELENLSNSKLNVAHLSRKYNIGNKTLHRIAKFYNIDISKNRKNYYKHNISSNGIQFSNEKIFYVYMWTNLINNKRYIGITLDVKQRKKSHINQINRPVGQAILKYGVDNFKFEVIHEKLTFEEASNLEIKYILEYNSINHGYNILEGGQMGTSNIQKFIHLENKIKEDVKNGLTQREIMYKYNIPRQNIESLYSSWDIGKLKEDHIKNKKNNIISAYLNGISIVNISVNTNTSQSQCLKYISDFKKGNIDINGNKINTPNQLTINTKMIKKANIYKYQANEDDREKILKMASNEILTPKYISEQLNIPESYIRQFLNKHNIKYQYIGTSKSKVKDIQFNILYTSVYDAHMQTGISYNKIMTDCNTKENRFKYV